jgi:rifampicin phosphotransferase
MPGFWVRDAVYMPRPVTPLAATTIVPAAEHGIAHGLTTMGGRGDLVSLRVEDGYLYYGFKDTLPAPPPPGPDGIARLQQSFLDLPRRWDAEVLPRVQALQAELRTLAPPGVARGVAAKHAQRALAILKENWRMHFELFQPFGGGMYLLQSVVQQSGVRDPAMAMASLIAAQPNEISSIDGQLLRLGAGIEDAPHLQRASVAGPQALVQALRAEGDTLPGRLFREVWPRIAERPTTFDLGHPTWGEDPAPFHRAVAGGKDALDRAEVAHAHVKQRSRDVEAQVRATLPPASLPAFEVLLRGGRAAAHLHQTHHYWMDELTPGLVRLALLRCAAPLVAMGDLERREDAAYLTFGELVAALGGAPLPPNAVAQRKATREAQALRTPPPTLGEATPAMLALPVFANLYGVQDEADGPKDLLQGMAASPGRATGLARVVRTERDLDEVRPGEILVAVSTDPAWTAVMGRSAGLVTEVGGILSHAAVVARERGVPAVVGARQATQALRTGDLLEVDGEAGTVKVLARKG